jgi:hypothetical protein
VGCEGCSDIGVAPIKFRTCKQKSLRECPFREEFVSPVKRAEVSIFAIFAQNMDGREIPMSFALDAR